MSRPTGHRKATLRNLAKAIITHGRIETTVTKAKILRPFVEVIVTLGKKGTLHHRRQAFAKIGDKRAVHKIFEEISPLFAERNGGYTRIVRTRHRAGDAAEMALIEFVEFPASGNESEDETPAEATAPAGEGSAT
jgi:large subunit ribosomal protein L17